LDFVYCLFWEVEFGDIGCVVFVNGLVVRTGPASVLVSKVPRDVSLPSTLRFAWYLFLAHTLIEQLYLIFVMLYLRMA
jgi:hypothetical protein